MAADADSREEDDGAELLHRFRAGDEAAFRELLDRYGPLVSGRIARRLPDRLRRKVSVADVLQESLLAAYDGRDGLRDSTEDAFRAWLLTIADSKAVEAIRRFEAAAKRDARREVTRGHRADTRDYVARQSTPSQIAVGAEAAALAQHAMRRLHPDYREVLRLTRYEHLTLSEAAERMGRSREATKKLYARAMTRFRTEFRELGGDLP